MKRIALNILLMYSDRPGAALGAHVCESLKARLGRSFRVRQSTWNAELLKNGKLCMLAAEEASVSDVVMVAAPEGAPLDSEVTQWFNLWKARARRTPSALVGLLRDEPSGTSHVVEESLERFAGSAKMDFFCHSSH